MHVRNNFATDSVFDWLGDNMYSDETYGRDKDQELKRKAYNAARDDTHYATFGPVADPKIPTTGTWDGT
jgi:hypothetical protein